MSEINKNITHNESKINKTKKSNKITKIKITEIQNKKKEKKEQRLAKCLKNNLSRRKIMDSK